jgi:hypothetical protein
MRLDTKTFFDIILSVREVVKISKKSAPNRIGSLPRREVQYRSSRFKRIVLQLDAPTGEIRLSIALG